MAIPCNNETDPIEKMDNACPLVHFVCLCQHACLSVCLSIYLSLRLSVCLSVSLHACLSVIKGDGTTSSTGFDIKYKSKPHAEVIAMQFSGLRYIMFSFDS